ncbi:cell division protein FtsL [Mariluticola halotolerans]|uniref:cell division protein FtsL n=1 Tax=Mariluticola halotolerans TaxID=2909283 RepID=UPI0026E414F1|nr:hypothetical protein [Mariluticola halotolerans]UJQ94599.1 hypothetical protein L1P08_00985 [Mariluticola halotolerans]
MIRGLNFLLLITSVLALVGVYTLKYHTVDTANEKLALQRQIEKQEADLSLLKADWAYLNQPAHIAPIVRRHAEVLGVAVIDQAQFIHITDIPMRTAQTDDDALTELFKSLDAGVDPIAALIEASVQ